MRRYLALAALVFLACDEPEAQKLTAVSVLRLDRTRSCFETLTPSQPPDPMLGLTEELCSTEAGPDMEGEAAAEGSIAIPTLVAGVDLIHVIVDYGPDIHFTKTATIPPPTIVISIDGQPVAVKPQLSAPLRGEDDRVYFVAELRAPSTLTRNMTVTATVAASFMWQVPVTFETEPAVPSLSILRRKNSSAGPCYEDLTAMEQPVDEALLASEFRVCESAADIQTLLAGIDQLLLVADYGPELSFDSAAAAPVPQFSVSVDGAVVGGEIPPTAHIVAPGRVYFVANVTAPSTPSDHVRISLRDVSGSGFNRASRTEFRSAPIAPAFTLLKWIDGQKCYSNMAPDETSIDQELAEVIGNICVDDAPTTMTAGIDRLGVLIDYGATVSFAQPSAVPAPTVGLVLEGQASTTTIRLGSAQVTDSGRAYFFGSARAPAAPADDVGLALALPTGFGVQLATRFSILPVIPEISVAGCADEGCIMVAGVGNATVTVRVPGALARTVTLRTSVAERTLQAGTTTTIDTTVLGDYSEGRSAIRVPETGEGAEWRIEAALDGQIARAPAITLQSPRPTAALECELPCRLPAGSVLALQVTAPADIHAAQALVTQRLNGGIIGATSPLDLSVVDISTQTRSGVTQVTAPTQAGTWSIDVSVNGYHTQPVVAEIEVSP